MAAAGRPAVPVRPGPPSRVSIPCWCGRVAKVGLLQPGRGTNARGATPVHEWGDGRAGPTSPRREAARAAKGEPEAGGCFSSPGTGSRPEVPLRRRRALPFPGPDAVPDRRCRGERLLRLAAAWAGPRRDRGRRPFGRDPVRAAAARSSHRLCGQAGAVRRPLKGQELARRRPAATSPPRGAGRHGGDGDRAGSVLLVVPHGSPRIVIGDDQQPSEPPPQVLTPEATIHASFATTATASVLHRLAGNDLWGAAR